MVAKRGKTYAAIAIIVLAVELMAPVWVSIPVLLVGLFFLAWAVAPVETQRVIDAVPSARFRSWMHTFDKWIESPHESVNRLRSAKNGLREFWISADQMYHILLDAKLQEQEHPGSIKANSVRSDDCQSWSSDAKDFITETLGESQADVFSNIFPYWGQYDWNDTDFLMRFLAKKKKPILELAETITETDLLNGNR